MVVHWDRMLGYMQAAVKVDWRGQKSACMMVVAMVVVMVSEMVEM